MTSEAPHYDFDQLTEGQKRLVLEQVAIVERTGGTSTDSLRFKEQLAVANDNSLSKALLCGRRAGKTQEAIFEVKDALDQNPGCRVVYIGLTRPSAKNIIWELFKQLNRDHKWGLTFKESELKVIHPNGSIFFVVGADKESEIDKIRGVPNLVLAIIDECGKQKPLLLQYLVEDVLEPGLMDMHGTKMLLGTPGLALTGFWYEVTTGKRSGWSVHTWTAHQNPHVRAREYIEKIKEERGWQDDNPILLREYFAKWVRDEARLVFAFDPERNVYTDSDAPDMDRHWSSVLSMDFGHVHSTAWTVLAYGSLGKMVYVPKSFKEPGLSPSQVADKTKPLVDDWGFDKIVGDLGGLGKGYSAEMVQRHGIYIDPADKREKRQVLEFLSDAFRTGQIKVHESCTGLIQELSTLLWDELHEDIADGQDDHECEALLYGWRECPAYMNREHQLSRETDGLPPWVDRDDDPEEYEDMRRRQRDPWDEED